MDNITYPLHVSLNLPPLFLVVLNFASFMEAQGPGQVVGNRQRRRGSACIPRRRFRPGGENPYQSTVISTAARSITNSGTLKKAPQVAMNQHQDSYQMLADARPTVQVSFPRRFKKNQTVDKWSCLLQKMVEVIGFKYGILGMYCGHRVVPVLWDDTPSSTTNFYPKP